MKASHMAIEFGFVCACGRDGEEDYTKGEVGKCDTACSGDENTMCGK